MKLATLDFETDPFEYGVEVKPFLGGYYDGNRSIVVWSENCVASLVQRLMEENEPLQIYVHNGGRFDFFFLIHHFTSSIRIVNGRIIQARLGQHEFRDSYAIMPFPLRDYDKDVIDYDLFKAENREQHREKILKYFRKDLTSLYELVTSFHKEFGDKLTIGSAAMKQIKARHKFETGNENYDAKFRNNFYFGGRNQVFQSGVIKGAIRVYDVNSMYPFVMSSFLHPLGVGHHVSNRIETNTVFVITEGKNYGAFPVREKNGSLNFTKESGVFHTTLHEFEAATETGCFKPERIIKTYGWPSRGTFDEFVNHFYDARAHAKRSGDKIHSLFYKYVLNSGYGKFAQNPNNYYDWYITNKGELPAEYHECTKSCVTNETGDCPLVWSPEFIHESYIIWKRPLQTKKFSWYNIATGASITGAARAVLLRGIHATHNPLYCDTDSIICSGESRVTVDPLRIGAWNLEASGRMAAIAGKKLYAIFDRTHPTDISHCIKKAHKGARISGAEILAIAQGETIVSESPVPNFKWDGKVEFTRRKIRKTA